MKNRRPRIGIPMRLELSTNRFYLGRDYSEAVEAAGGAPLHIPLIPHPDYINSLLDELDGVLLPGSDSDVDPLRYGQEPHQRLGTVQPLKDETDMLLLLGVEKRGMPVLAICFGMQILNVSRGGTLIQDIESQMPEAIQHEQGAPRERLSHRVTLMEGSGLALMAGEQNAMVNSHHHQAIEKVGRELVATAWTSDGLIEALEDTRHDHFALAVQWHPEIAWEKDAFSQAIFGHFIEAANSYTKESLSNSLNTLSTFDEPSNVR